MNEGIKAVFASPFAGPVECLVIRKLPPVDVWQWWNRYECRVIGDATRGWAGGTRFECFDGELHLHARLTHNGVLYTGAPDLSALKEAKP